MIIILTLNDSKVLFSHKKNNNIFLNLKKNTENVLKI